MGRAEQGVSTAGGSLGWRRQVQMLRKLSSAEEMEVAL